LPSVLFLTWSRNQPSTRYRVHQYLEGLSYDGFDVEVFLSGGLTLGRRYELLKRARAADVVYVQKKLFNRAFLPLLARANPNLLYDFDDAGFAVEPWETKPRGMAPGSPPTIKRLNAVLKRARGVVAGNEFLASYASQYNGAVHVLPTPVDTGGASPADAGGAVGTGRIGWLGTSKNLFYLKRIGPALGGIRRAFPDARLSVLSNAEADIDGITVENVPWSPQREAEWLRSIDVGIMPLENDDWSRGKCAFKLLQYMAAGLPTVSSPVGMNAEVIEDGVNGMLAATEEQWSRKIVSLLESPGLRKEMGAKARRTVEQKYSLEVCRRRMEEILRWASG
jgi:glycosyltransferase involved in cell wall biosynthesis